jgi:hypothetical protein
VTVILLDTVMVVGRTVYRPGIGKIIQVRHQSITHSDSHPAGHGHGRGADCLPPWHWQDNSGMINQLTNNSINKRGGEIFAEMWCLGVSSSSDNLLVNNKLFLDPATTLLRGLCW